MPVKGGYSRVVVLGALSVGKTTIIEQIVYGNYAEKSKTEVMFPTIEDTYDAYVETERPQKDRIRIYDTKGLLFDSPTIPAHYFEVAHAFMLVFSVTSLRSFQLVEQLKKKIEEKCGKDFPIVVLGSKLDLEEQRECNHADLTRWSTTEGVKLYEVLVENRNILFEPMTHLVKLINIKQGKQKKQKGPSLKLSKDSES